MESAVERFGTARRGQCAGKAKAIGERQVARPRSPLVARTGTYVLACARLSAHAVNIKACTKSKIIKSTGQSTLTLHVMTKCGVKWGRDNLKSLNKEREKKKNKAQILARVRR